MRIDWGAAWTALPVLLQGLLVTLQVTLLGMSLALLVGLIWTLSRRSPRRWISYPATGFVEAIRSTPLLVQVYFLFYVLPNYGIRLSPLATGVVAVGLHYSAYTSEVYRAGIEGLPRGQWEAATALNLRPFRTWMSIIIPQAIPPIIPALGNYFIAMFKDTPILSAIAVLEVMQTAKIIGSETFRYLEPFTLVGLLFLGLSLVAAALVRWAERKLGVRSASP